MPVADDSEGQVRVATSRGLRRIARFVLAGSLAVLPVTGLTPPAHAATSMELESCFLDQINAARAINGAAALELSLDLSEYGRSHSTTMAAAGLLFHSGSEQLEPVLPAGWQAWGENVGYATGSESCDWLFEAFWESPGHRDALLNPIFDLAGIGVIIDAEDTIWTTHVFVQTSNPPPTTTTQPAPPTTTTTTTTAPTATTTTTQAPPPTTTSSTTTPEPAATEMTNTSTTTVVTSHRGSGVSETANEAEAVESEAGTDTEVVAFEIGEPAVSGIDAGCIAECPTPQGYVMFLMFLGVAGSAVSWWAFRT